MTDTDVDAQPGPPDSAASQPSSRPDELVQIIGAPDGPGLDSSPRLVVVSGEPGSGKSRMLDDLSGLARERGWTTVALRGVQRRRTVPFGLLAVADDGGDLGAFAAADPAVPPDARTGQWVTDEVRRRHRLLGDAAGGRPLTVLVDDLHWCDEAAAALIERILHEPPAGLTLVVVSHRDGYALPGLDRTLASPPLRAIRLRPRPLRDADLPALLPDASPHRRRLLRRLSGGNPRYLWLLNTVDDAGLEALADRSRVAEPPPEVQSVLAAELAALSGAQRRVLHALAVADRWCPLDLLERMCAGLDADIPTALDELAALGLVVASGPCFGFRHPVAASAAYHDAGPAWRLRAHRAAAEFLRARDAPLDLQARHLSVAAPYGDRAAVLTLTDAATAVLSTAPATAADWLSTALRMLPGGRDTADLRGEVMLRLARARGLSGDLAACRTILHELLGIRTPHRAVAVRFCVVASRLLGRLEEARALLEAELDRAEPLGEDDTMRLTVELAAVHILRSDTTACARAAGRVVTMARRAGNRGQLAAGETLVALADLHRGDTDAARSRLAQVVALVDAHPDAGMREHLHLFPPLAWLELNLEQAGEAARHVHRGIAIARGSGQKHALPYLFIVEAQLLTRAGHLERARRRTDQAIAMSRAMGSSEILAMARAAALCGTLWQRGPQAASAVAQELITDGAPKSEWWAEVAATAVAIVRAAAPRPGDQVDSVADIPTDLTPLLRPQLWGATAVLLAGQGRPEAAIALAQRAVTAAGDMGLPFQLGVAQHSLATVLGAAHQHAASAEAATAAMASLATAGAPLHEAMAREALGHALTAAGDHREARREIGRAKASYAAAGARWLASQATRHEVRIGARAPRKRPALEQAAGDGLSERELEVAQLAADGLTNREIAQRLYLSQKTVETHLGKVFNKLGARSRVDMAARLAAGRPGDAPAGQGQ